MGQTHALHRLVMIVLGGLLVVSFTGCAIYAPFADDPAEQAGADAMQKIGTDVFDALENNGEANIVIALTNPASMDAIPALQADVLSALDDIDAATYEIRMQFESVPIITARVLSRDVVLALAAHPDVVRIDLDTGGGGGG